MCVNNNSKQGAISLPWMNYKYMVMTELIASVGLMVCGNSCLQIVWGLTPILTLFSILSLQSVSLIYYAGLPISPKETDCYPNIISESAVRDKWPLHSMSKISCYGEGSFFRGLDVAIVPT